MKLNLKEYFKLSVIYALVAAFPAVLQIIILPLIEGTDRLNVIDFSHLAITESITVLAFTIAMYSMGNAIARFYYDYMNDKTGYNKLVSGIFTSILFRGLVILGIAIIFSNYIGKIFPQKELQDFSSYGYASIIIGINRAINITAATLYRNEKKVNRYILLNVILGILRTGLQVYMLFFYEMSFIGYVYGTCIGTGITAITILGYTYYKSGIRYDRKLMSSVYKFARPLFQYGIIVWGLMYADRYFLKLHNFQVELGIYDTAIRFVLGMQMILQGIQGATQPEIYRFMKDGIQKNREQIKQLSNILLAQTQIIVAVAIIPVMLFLTMFFETKLQYASSLIAILFMMNILRTQYVIFSFPIYFLKKTRFFLYLNLFVLIINLLLNYLLVPLLKEYGAIIAILVSYSIQAIFTFIYQQKISHLNWNLNKILFFPISIILIAAILEILKNVFDINPYITSSIIVLTIILSLFSLYRKEIKGIFIRK